MYQQPSAFSFQLWGFPVHIEASNLIICGLLGLMSSVASNMPIYGVFVAFVLFTSIFLHECGHAWMALRQGARVIEMRMTALGGHVQYRRGLSHFRAFLVTLAGPMVNLIIAAIAWALMNSTLFLPPYLRILLYVYFQWNVMLIIFNMIPAVPLDGGHMLHRLLMMAYSRIRKGEIFPSRRWSKTPDQIVGIIGVVFAVAWIPTMFIIYQKYGILPLFMLPLQYNMALAKGDAKIPL